MSIGLVCWLALIAIVCVYEAARRNDSLSNLARFIGRRLPGRIVIVLIWGFLGFHLFSRYGSPHR